MARKEVNRGYMQQRESQMCDLVYMKYKNKQMMEIKAHPSGMRGGALRKQRDETWDGGSVLCLYLGVSYMNGTNWAI